MPLRSTCRENRSAPVARRQTRRQECREQRPEIEHLPVDAIARRQGSRHPDERLPAPSAPGRRSSAACTRRARRRQRRNSAPALVVIGPLPLPRPRSASCSASGMSGKNCAASLPPPHGCQGGDPHAPGFAGSTPRRRAKRAVGGGRACATGRPPAGSVSPPPGTPIVTVTVTIEHHTDDLATQMMFGGDCGEMRGVMLHPQHRAGRSPLRTMSSDIPDAGRRRQARVRRPEPPACVALSPDRSGRSARSRDRRYAATRMPRARG